MQSCLINTLRIHPKPNSWGKPNDFQPLDIAYNVVLLKRKHKACIIDASTEGMGLLAQERTSFRPYENGIHI